MRTAYVALLAMALPFYLAIGYGIYSFLPAIHEPIAIKCIAVTCLLTLVVTIENVSHERLFSTAIDPIKGQETPYLKFAQRLLVSNVEQFIVFAVGLVALSNLIEDQRYIVVLTATWVISRYVFWFAYSKGSQYRTVGLVGMIQSILVLAYVCYLVWPPALAIFAAAEAIITYRAVARSTN